MATKKLNLSIKIPENQSMAAKVYEQLLHAIIDGRLKDGDRIVETDLERTLGISRTPIREALHMLEIDGLTELIPYRGMVVKGITTQEIRDTLEMKAMTEGYASGVFAMCARKEDVQYLESVLKDQLNGVFADNLTNAVDSNDCFHNKIIESVKNDALLKIYRGLAQRIRRLHTIGLMATTGLQISFDEHSKILNQIKNHDPAAAEIAAREHAFNTLNRVLLQLKKSTGERDG